MRKINEILDQNNSAIAAFRSKMLFAKSERAAIHSRIAAAKRELQDLENFLALAPMQIEHYEKANAELQQFTRDQQIQEVVEYLETL